MSCCCGSGEPSGDGDCAHVSDQVRSCQKWYGDANARDMVNGPVLAAMLEALTTQVNRHSVALGHILRADCSLKDGLILCRHLSPEIGVSCLTGRGGDLPPAPTPPAPEAGGPILDFGALSNAYGGWSLRLLRTEYEGPLIRVRRSLDNAEMDIYASEDGYVDTSDISAFAEASDCFVSVIYDQVDSFEHTHDLLQPVPGQQGQIYDSVLGFITNSEGRIAIALDGSDDAYYTDDSNLVETSSRMLLAIALERTALGNKKEVYFDPTVAGGAGNPSRIASRADKFWTMYLDHLQSPETDDHEDDFIDTPHLLTLAAWTDGDPMSVRARYHGLQEAVDDSDGSVVVDGHAQLWLASNAAAEDFSTQLFSELVYFDQVDWRQYMPGLDTTLVQALEHNMMLTWGVTPAV